MVEFCDDLRAWLRFVLEVDKHVKEWQHLWPRARFWASQVALVVKNPPAMQEMYERPVLFPGSGRSPGEGNGNSLQYSCLENPRDREAWRATVLGITKSQTQLKQLNMRQILSGRGKRIQETKDHLPICCWKIHDLTFQWFRRCDLIMSLKEWHTSHMECVCHPFR